MNCLDLTFPSSYWGSHSYVYIFFPTCCPEYPCFKTFELVFSSKFELSHSWDVDFYGMEVMYRLWMFSGYVDLSLWQLHAYVVLESDKTLAYIVLLLVAKEKNYFRIETHKDLVFNEQVEFRRICPVIGDLTVTCTSFLPPVVQNSLVSRHFNL